MKPNPGLAPFGAGVATGGPRTIVVLGVGRGGTSMVAAVLAGLGVFCGDDAKAPRFEDARLARAMRGESYEATEAVIADYDARHETWAFKYPPVAQEPTIVHDALRNPHYVAVFRDLLAVANRRRVSIGHDLGDALASVHRQYGAVLAFLDAERPPALLVSYEKALGDPEAFVRAVAAFCGVAATDEAIASASRAVEASPLAYLATSASRPRLAGHLDEVNEHGVRGWAITGGAAAAEVAVLVDGREIRRVVADRHRADLVGAVHPDGRCAFAIDDLPDGWLPPGSELRVVHAEERTDLVGSPRRG